jgi:hypothetical protein
MERTGWRSPSRSSTSRAVWRSPQTVRGAGPNSPAAVRARRCVDERGLSLAGRGRHGRDQDDLVGRSAGGGARDGAGPVQLARPAPPGEGRARRVLQFPAGHSSAAEREARSCRALRERDNGASGAVDRAGALANLDAPCEGTAHEEQAKAEAHSPGAARPATSTGTAATASPATTTTGGAAASTTTCRRRDASRAGERGPEPPPQRPAGSGEAQARKRRAWN